MGKDLTLTASDGFQLGAYRADPATAPKAAIVVIQEIFGVNHHIRAVCDRYAAKGYVAIAPSIFDRTEPNFTSGYSPDEIAVARKFVANPDWAAMLRDTQAAIDHYWDHLLDGGKAMQCGWLTDRYGLTWQIVPSKIGEWMQNPAKAAKVSTSRPARCGASAKDLKPRNMNLGLLSAL